MIAIVKKTEHDIWIDAFTHCQFTCLIPISIYIWTEETIFKFHVLDDTVAERRG